MLESEICENYYNILGTIPKKISDEYFCTKYPLVLKFKTLWQWLVLQILQIQEHEIFELIALNKTTVDFVF